MQILLPGQISFNLEDVKANLKRSINKKVQNVIKKVKQTFSSGR